MQAAHNLQTVSVQLMLTTRPATNLQNCCPSQFAFRTLVIPWYL